MTMDSDHDGFGDGLEDPVLAELLTELRAIADEPAPAIGPDLAAVMGGAVPLASSRTRSRAASMLVVGLLSTGVLTGGIGAAAADQLPAPVQRVVARVVNTMTPFEIPDRAERIPMERTPDEEAPVQPTPTERDEDTPPPDGATAPSPAESESGSDDPATDPADEGGDESDHQSGGEEGDRSIDDGTREEDEGEDRDADQRDLDSDDSDSDDSDSDDSESDDSESDAPDESSTGDGSGGTDGSDDGAGGFGDDSEDDGVESDDVDD